MSKYDRQFSRSVITWKLTDVTRESIKATKFSADLPIMLGNEKIIPVR